MVAVSLKKDFFQAEDGILDTDRSRGLGDVYKRQLVDLVQLGSNLAREHSTGSFRLTFNTGSEAGQTVFHAHGHITSTTPSGKASTSADEKVSGPVDSE